ncbi:hypothetical protein GUJ93_ZPchr0001g30770 [Zizania palustris]|uniref:Uncharacterized protein n=1 Tax=Zizania palustris TaxID=103762 RepID=A0A8J5SCG0_ZIZPA|nr:hypothetical protein GUJ93_ZPchr0001g30770 [Zizania palustris]
MGPGTDTPELFKTASFLSLGSSDGLSISIRSFDVSPQYRASELCTYDQFGCNLISEGAGTDINLMK